MFESTRSYWLAAKRYWQDIALAPLVLAISLLAACYLVFALPLALTLTAR